MRRQEAVSVAWLRRDLRLDDNRALFEASASGHAVLVLFIFDSGVLEELDRDDHRLAFIHDTLSTLHRKLNAHGGGIHFGHGRPVDIFKTLTEQYDITSVHAASDYEPYARQRDEEVAACLAAQHIPYKAHKDQVIFEKNEIVKQDGSPYTVFAPYKKQWLRQLGAGTLGDYSLDPGKIKWIRPENAVPTLTELGFRRSAKKIRPFDLSHLDKYEQQRNYPAIGGTSHLGPHLRFGTVSIRSIVSRMAGNESFLSELIWREFFMQILYHYPRVVYSNFKEKYNSITWRNDEEEFTRWCWGRTGYPMVDAGMRQLNATGYMHNRVRMITAGFLCKHLLIDWRWGEAYFAGRLSDYELSSNNGNWQWAAGTGCDAAPYFRIFNPEEQLRRFDPEMEYVRQWIPEYGTDAYPEPVVAHRWARERALEVYKKALKEK